VSARGREAAEGYLFLLPNILGVLVFVPSRPVGDLPFVHGLEPAARRSFVGLDNYQTLISDDPLFRKVVGNTVLYVIATVPRRSCPRWRWRSRSTRSCAVWCSSGRSTSCRRVVDRRGRAGLALALQPELWPDQRVPGPVRHPGRPGSVDRLGAAGVAIMTIWKNVGLQWCSSWRPAGVPEHLSEAARSMGAAAGQVRQHHTAAALATTFL